MRQDDHYSSYLLRLWFDDQLEAWQLSLSSIQSGTDWQPESLEEMVQFLQKQMEKRSFDNPNQIGGIL